MIPINILCEPLLKQIEISNYHTAGFNIFDFEFFRNISFHKKLTITTALLLLDTLSKISLTSVHYYRAATEIIKTIMSRFNGASEL